MFQGDRQNCGSEQTSDFDSVSTTSASYVLNHSDLDSLLNDNSPCEDMRIFEGQKQVSARASGTGAANAHGQAVTSATAAAGGSECGRASTTSKTSVGSSESVSQDERLDSGACDKFVSSISKESNLLAGNKNNKKTDPIVGDCENEKSASQKETTSGETRRKKSAVSQLIARFESQTGEQIVNRVSPLPHVRFSRSVTPERGLSSSQSSVPGFLRQRSVTPDQRPASASATLAPNAEESLLRKAVVNSAVVAQVVAEEVDLNDNPVEEKESGEEKVNAPFGGKSDEEEKVIKEKTKHSKDETISEEITNDEDGKWFNYFVKHSFI